MIKLIKICYQVMATALGVPLCDMTFEDIKEMYSTKTKNPGEKEEKKDWQIPGFKRPIKHKELVLKSLNNSFQENHEHKFKEGHKWEY